MNIYTKFILLTLFFGFVQLSSAQDQCEACLSNSLAYCVDKSSYYLCMNGKPLKSTLQKCPKDTVCTNSVAICELESETVKAVCDSSCSKCPTSGSPYTCVSKTQFGRCINDKIAIVDSCETGSICSVEMLSVAGEICAPTCVTEFFGVSSTCNNDEPITTTIAPPSTPNVATLKDKCKVDDKYQNADTKIYYVINDDDCKTYIYCEKIDGDIEALFMRCSTGFYDVNLNKCVADKPETCGAEVNTPQI